MKIDIIPCLSDNYSYVVTCDRTGDTVIVDACEAAPILAKVKKARAIWSTHHHHDHVGGNEEVAKALGISRVYGYATDKGRIPAQTHFLNEGDTFTIGSLLVRAIHIPGHTLGAVAYVVTREPHDPIVFTGDTLFLAGCGRLFEGDPPMMHASLSKLARLEGRTRVYCGHEYTVANLRFAKHVEPSNAAIDAAMKRANELRAKNQPTVPMTIADELAHNPFLRVESREIRKTLGIAESASPDEALGVIREAKNTYK